MTIRLALFGLLISGLVLACGKVKTPESDAGANVPGADALAQCVAPEESCSGSCVNTQTDNDNCGDCDMACASDRECVTGGCECAASTVECSGNCVDPLTDNLFCGAGSDCTSEPGVACDAQSSCLDGVCRRSLQNGSFETGDYTGWILADDAPAGNEAIGIWALLQAGTSLDNPPKGQLMLFDHQDAMEYPAECLVTTIMTFPTSIVSDGLWAGLHTQNDSARHTLTQTFFVRATDTSLTWDMAYETQGFAPGQFLALNINTPMGVLVDTPLKIADEAAGDPLSQPTFMAYSVDLTPYQGTEIQIELELMVQDACFTVFFDNFSVQ